jgi:hypothetical protein
MNKQITSPKIIIQSLKFMPRTNNLAYFDKASGIVKNCFITLTPGVDPMKK